MEAPPSVTILLLGDPACGKSTFLSHLGKHANSTHTKNTGLPSFRDIDQPFLFDIRMYNRPYRFQFYDTASPENYTLLRPDLVIICYGIDDRRSLVNAQEVWRKVLLRNYARDRDDVAVMLLGLKRDLRGEGEGVIHPQEGLRIAQEMRCDRYAECSAISGDLMNEVIEDITRMAAKSSTEAGALSSGGCNLI